MTSTESPRAAPRRPGPPPGASIPAVFRERVRRHPDSAALVDGDRSLSYARLDRASDAMAHRLRKAGVAPGHLVPVVLPRSVELVVALLAVLKCGAAYGALDPSWPREHLHALVRRLDAKVVVTGDGPAWPVPAVPPVPPGEAYDSAGAGPVPVEIADDRPAMVFFTSGTTGTPKAVVCSHRAVLRLPHDEVLAGLGPGSAMPLAAPPPWDAFALELWSMLLTGGTSVLIDGPYLLPDTLRTAVRERGVDTVWLTASLFNLFVDEDPASFSGLRQVLTGGERLSPHHVRAFLAAHPDVELVNGYGPVESTVFATVHRIGGADPDRPAGIPVGRPFAGTEVHVLDGDRPCGPDEPGEICVGGDGLATGYLGDPERTAAAFVTVEIAGSARRLYRTGDRGHRSADGLLHFGGRADRQVKLRGHRVEPAQIEALAGQVPGLARAVALPVTDPNGTCQGIALFYTEAPGREVTPEQVRTELSRRAPRHLVPDRVERVDRLPVTANGKVDHTVLLERVRTGPPPDSPSAHQSPDQDLATTVAAAFAEVLGVAHVSPDDSFFRMGGNSLAAGRVSVRLSGRLGVPVPVSRVVAHPTARQLGVWLRGRGTPEQPPRSEVAGPGGSGGSGDGPGGVPLEHMQASFCFMHQLDPQDLAPLCPMVWEIDGPLDLAALEAALADVERRHEALRASYVVRGGTPVAVVTGAAEPVPLHRLTPSGGTDGSTDDGAGGLGRLLGHLARPLAVERGEVWRHAVLRSGDRTLFGAAVHHVAFDGWSQSVLARDLSTAYEARAHGREPRFGAPAPSLRQVADELRRQRGRLPADEQRRFWARELAGLPDLAVPDPADGRRETRETAADRLGFTVPAEDLARYDEAAGEMGGTRFTVLLAAFARALHRVTGQESLGVGVPVAKRGSELLDQAVTCLIDTVCLPLRGIAQQDPTALLDTVHRVSQRALAAQDVPFSEVVRIANPPRGARSPLFQVMFALQDTPPPVLRIAGRTSRCVPTPVPRAMAELVAEVRPTADGGAAAELSHQPEAADGPFAHAVCSAYQESLRLLAGRTRRTPEGMAR